MKTIIARYPSTANLNVLEKFSIFKNLTPEIKEIFIKGSNIITISSTKNSNSELLLENKIYILLEGDAFLSCIEKDGKKIIIDVLKEGSILGYVEPASQGEPLENCLFIEPFSREMLIVCEFEKHYFINILSKSPSLALYAFYNLTNRMSRLEKKIEEMTFLDLETRLLAELGRLKTTGVTKITQERLAQILGVVRETISKTLAKLRKSGVILRFCLLLLSYLLHIHYLIPSSIF